MLRLKIEWAGAVVSPPAGGLGPTVEVWRDNEGEICAYGETIGQDCWMHLPGLASFRFSPTADEVTAVAGKVSEHLLVDAFHRRVLPMALQVRGREVLHASSVLTPSGVVAFCGISESGKSTIAHELNQRGYDVWADDLVAFELTDKGPDTVLLPFKIRLRRPAQTLFTLHAVQPTRYNGPASGQDSQTAPLAAICVLRKLSAVKDPVAVRRVPPVHTFATVLPHAYFFTFNDPERKRLMIQHYLELVAQVPIFEIRYREGLEHLTTVLAALEPILRDSRATTEASCVTVSA